MVAHVDEFFNAPGMIAEETKTCNHFAVSRSGTATLGKP
jgi:hypothetical protein